VKILLTVSPVPLVATYEKRHVLVSNTVSKSVLRVAADEVERAFDNVIYFPSYEIITSPANSGKYYQDDLRRVTDIGIDHVMRVFSKHFLVNQSIKKYIMNQLRLRVLKVSLIILSAKRKKSSELLNNQIFKDWLYLFTLRWLESEL